jgi:hypothetical protein
LVQHSAGIANQTLLEMWSSLVIRIAHDQD